MKSAPTGTANIKMRGKKTKLMACGCCVASNFKFRELLKQADKQIKEHTL